MLGLRVSGGRKQRGNSGQFDAERRATLRPVCSTRFVRFVVDKPVAILKPSPVPLPTGLVV